MPIIDTDLIINFLRKKPKAVQLISKLIKANVPLKTTIFNVGELYKGAYLASNVAKSLRGITDLLKHFEIIHYTLEDAIIYGQISAELRKSGKTIGDLDELIASLALNHNETLITRNIKHYNSIPRISLQNWESLD
ncbi:MAG: type II toxin-antitoxin system VapC family toxin [Promethearchaeota archaeon]